MNKIWLVDWVWTPTKTLESKEVHKVPAIVGRKTPTLYFVPLIRLVSYQFTDVVNVTLGMTLQQLLEVDMEHNTVSGIFWLNYGIELKARIKDSSS